MDVIMPRLGESVEEGTISVWHKKPGDSVAIDEILLEIETDKVATEVPSLAAGVVRDILVPEGATVKVGAVLCVIDVAGGEEKPQNSSLREGGADQAIQPAGRDDAVGLPRSPAFARDDDTGASRSARTAPDGTPLSPAVRRLLSHHGLDPAAIRGTGRGGRIQRQDVLAALDGGVSAPAPAAAKPSGANVERVPFTTLRQKIARNMIRSKTTSAHVLQAIEADFSAVERVRSFMKDAFREAEGKSLTYLPFIARAVCLALPDFPDLNAERDGDSLLRHREINLGFAIDLDRKGLVAPVLKNAGGLKVPALARAIQALSDKARAGKLSPDDMTGAGYTITNNGSFGTLITAPIINQPQVAILSTDGIRKRPVVIEGPDGDEIVIRPVGILAQSFDHCVVDGSTSGAFLNRLKEILETRNWAADFV